MEFVTEAEFARMLEMTQSRVRKLRDAGQITFGIEISSGGGRTYYAYEAEQAKVFVEKSQTFLGSKITGRLDNPRKINLYLEEEDFLQLEAIAGTRRISPVIRSIVKDFLIWIEREEDNGTKNQLRS